METITFQVETELIFHRLTTSLDEFQIPYTFKTYTDISFPVLDQTKAYADISIPKEYLKDTESIYKALNIEPKVIEEKNNLAKNNFKIWQILLISYSILVTIFLFKYWYIYKKNNSDDKNFKYEWSYDNKDLSVKSKKTGNNVYMHTDDNFNFNFEEYRSFSKDGFRIIESHDLNEDGIFEKTFIFNLNDEQIVQQLDINNDGIIESMEIVLENKDTLKLTDNNQNGYYEITK